MRFPTVLILCGIAVASLSAADFWSTREFTAWEEKEVQKLLSNSPWAAEFAIQDPSAGRASAAAAAVGATGSIGRGRVPMQIFTIMWRSSTPIKQALVRMMSPAGVTPEAQEFLDRPEPDYLVSIAAPKQFFGPVTSDPDQLRSFMTLNIKGQPPRSADAVELQEDQTGLSINYRFPRAPEITASDREVEVHFQMERRLPEDAEPNARTPKPLEIKRKFRLKNMTFEGSLNL